MASQQCVLVLVWAAPSFGKIQTLREQSNHERYQIT